MINVSEEYDNQLNTIAHYRKYPQLKPWIGSSYSESNIKLLFIGESHYLGDGITYHHDVDKWYEGFSDKIFAGTFTRDIIKTYANRSVKRKSRTIFVNMGKAICQSKVFSSLNENTYTVYKHISFMNFFQRPAEITGNSINVTPKDKEVSNITFQNVVEIIKPDVIVFGSKKAYKFVDKNFLDENKISYVVTPHPATSWWNRVSKNYGNKKGKDIVPDFLNEYKKK